MYISIPPRFSWAVTFYETMICYGNPGSYQQKRAYKCDSEEDANKMAEILNGKDIRKKYKPEYVDLNNL